MIINSFLSKDELLALNFKSLGNNVLISRKASIYNAENIEIGNNVRIDDFCILSGAIILHNYIHISAFCGLYAGSAKIEIHNFAGISPNSMLFAESDDFSGRHMIGPMVPDDYRQIISGKITLKKYVQIGAGSVILPSTTLYEGSVVGSMSLVRQSTDPWSIYCGNPLYKLKDREKDLLELEKNFYTKYEK